MDAEGVDHSSLVELETGSGLSSFALPFSWLSHNQQYITLNVTAT